MSRLAGLGALLVLWTAWVVFLARLVLGANPLLVAPIAILLFALVAAFTALGAAASRSGEDLPRHDHPTAARRPAPRTAASPRAASAVGDLSAPRARPSDEALSAPGPAGDFARRADSQISPAAPGPARQRSFVALALALAGAAIIFALSVAHLAQRASGGGEPLSYALLLREGDQTGGLPASPTQSARDSSVAGVGLPPSLTTAAGGEGDGDGTAASEPPTEPTPTPTLAPGPPATSAAPAPSPTVAAAPPPAGAADLSGAWRLIDTITSGRDAGSAFEFAITLVQQGNTISGGGSGLVIRGRIDGRTVRATFTRPGGTGTFTWTIQPDGSLSGRFTDEGSRNSGMSVAVR